MQKNEAIQFARILHHALPYLEKYRGLYIVAKLGGNVLDSTQLLQSFARDLLFMRRNGIHVLVVHGGGPHISRRLQREGIKSHFIKGSRFSDARTAKIVEQVLAEVNAVVSEAIRQTGVEVASFADCSARLIRARTSTDSDTGPYTGEVEKIAVRLLQQACNAEKIPVISPIGHDQQGRAYNINADFAAGQIAQSLHAGKLILLTNVPGILNEDGALCSELGASQAKQMMEQNIILEGMRPKILSALGAVDNGVPRAHIIDANLPHAVLLEIFTEEGVGTLIKAHPDS